MLRSMTGFGKGEASFGEGQHLVVEVSSVNRKQLEVRTAFPPELVSQEIPARKMVQEYISRGAVQLRVSVNSTGAAGQGAVNRELLRSLIRECQEMRREFGLHYEVAVETLMSVPGVLGATPFSPENQPAAVEALETALRGALEKFQEMRTVEGEALRRDFSGRLAVLEKLLGEIVELKEPLTEVQADLKKLRDIRYWVRKATPGTEESKEPPKKQPIKEALQDKADEKKAQRTVPAQAKHKQQDMEL